MAKCGGAVSKEKVGVDVGAVDGGVAAGGPARAVTQVRGVVLLADVNISTAPDAGADHLRVTAEAEIIVRLGEHFFVHRTVRLMANDAAFAQRGVLEDERPRLLAVALGAGLVVAGERQAALGFHDVHAVRVMALDAVHLAFEDGVMLRKIELRVCLEMAGETGLRIAAGIDNELVGGIGDVFAARAVAGFATLFADQAGLFQVQARVRAGGKGAGDGCVTVGTDAVADKGGALDGRRGHDGAGKRGAGVEQENRYGGSQGAGQRRHRTDKIHALPPGSRLNASCFITGL